jgi:thiamine pyrophosphokinase
MTHACSAHLADASALEAKLEQQLRDSHADAQVVHDLQQKLSSAMGDLHRIKLQQQESAICTEELLKSCHQDMHDTTSCLQQRICELQNQNEVCFLGSTGCACDHSKQAATHPDMCRN